MQDILGFDITTRKREVNHIVELNGIKHIYLPVFLTDTGDPSIKYKEIVSEYDQEIPQSQTADNPVAPRGRAAQPSQDTRKTN